MLAVERRNQILEKLQEEKRVVVSELSQIYQVSEETIRRDLEKLHQDGLAIKSYGGAIFNENTNIDMPFNIRKKHNIVGKQKIADLIEKMIGDGDHIILDASTTAVFIAKALKKKERLTVITNSVEIIVELSDMPAWNVICTGGVVKEGSLALVGPQVLDGLKGYNAEIAVISCKGIDMERGITEGNEQFASAKQGMMGASMKCYLAVDYSKFGNVAFTKICDFSRIDAVITDKKPDDKWVFLFQEQGIECIYPEK